MHVLASKQVVHRGTRIFIVRLWKFPSGPPFVVALRVRLYDGDVDIVGEAFDKLAIAKIKRLETKKKTFDMSHEVYTVGKRAEVANIEMVSSLLRRKLSAFLDNSMPAIISSSFVNRRA